MDWEVVVRNSLFVGGVVGSGVRGGELFVVCFVL